MINAEVFFTDDEWSDSEDDEDDADTHEQEGGDDICPVSSL